ncbi:MAG: hypothetical protein ACREOF_09705 [Gemmatimonadales bacterium]
MLPICRAPLVAWVFLLGGVVPARAQASLYLPLDDARLPLLEHLIARRDVDDPTPMVRPFRLADAVRVLAQADSAPNTPGGKLIRELRSAFTEDTAEARWEVQVRAGGDAYTQKRKDALHLGGEGTANPYADVALRGAFGPVAFATRPALEPRLIGDPDWPNQAQDHLTGRLAEGYLSLQFKYGNVTYGQLERNWGPVGYWAIPLSNYSYQRQGLALTLGTGDLRLDAIASDLQGEEDSLGQPVNRYLIVHRLDARLARRLRLALWESIIIAGQGRILETPFANPISPTVVANTFGIQDLKSNIIIGADIHLRVSDRTTFQAQLALDDFLFNTRDQGRDRWALTLAAYGPVGRTLGWRALYTQASSLAFRTFVPEENFVDAGVGTGRNFSDMDLVSVSASIPTAAGLLLMPDLTVQRQGEGRIIDPYPLRGPDGVLVYPAWFVGTVERTYRVGLGVSGRVLGLDVAGSGGFHHVVNDQNQAGMTADRFVGTIRLVASWQRRGRLR